MSLAHAIKNRRIATFTYKLKVRVIEPHCLGVAADGRMLLRAYQTAPETGWRLFHVDDIADLNETSVPFDVRLTEGYKPGDTHMKQILVEI